MNIFSGKLKYGCSSSENYFLPYFCNYSFGTFLAHYGQLLELALSLTRDRALTGFEPSLIYACLVNWP